MSYRLVRALRGFQPVYCLADGIILMRGRRLFRADPDLETVIPFCSLPNERLLGRIPGRLAARILRLGAQSAAMIDEDMLLVSRRSRIFRVRLSTGEWALDFTIPDGRRLLNLATITDPTSGRQAICFGEYSTGFDGSAIRVWRRDAAAGATWQATATFGAGEIDHVHNICQMADGAIYLLTGDFDAAAAIWKSDFALTDLVPVHRGSQAFRACWAWQGPDGALLYATDSQLETNRLIRVQGGHPVPVAELLGSSIHACTDARRLIFSTTVEPGMPSGRRWRDLLDRRRGPGILADDAAIYAVQNGQPSIVHREPKDRWPMRLAQFGTFRFPNGIMPADGFFAYGVGVRDHDGQCLKFVGI